MAADGMRAGDDVIQDDHDAVQHVTRTRYEVARLVASLGFTDGDEDRIANAVMDYLLALPVEQRMEAMGMKSRRWHFCMDFEPHETCNTRCRTVWEENDDQPI